jgi:chemotaxis family two-component system sensor kinase Cph1
LPPRVETALYRIAQEALTNVVRHAQARNVGVLLEVRDTFVLLIIEDDGKGFDVSWTMGSHVHQGNLGLYGMRERAALLGGTLTVESAPGEGTSVFAQIPLDSGGSSDGQDPHPDR